MTDSAARKPGCGEGAGRRPQDAPGLFSTWPTTATAGSGWGSPKKETTYPGSDRLLDALVAYGTPEAIAARLKEHLDAGADHVPVQILTKDENLVSALAELAVRLD